MLPVFPEVLSHKARLQLVRLGVEVRTGSRVTGIEASGMQMSKTAARNILARLADRPSTTFRYIDHGSLAMIGFRNRVVVKND